MNTETWIEVNQQQFFHFFNVILAAKSLHREDSFKKEQTLFYLTNATGEVGDMVGRVEGFDKQKRKFYINQTIQEKYTN